MSSIIRQRSATLQRFTGGLNNYWDQSSIADNELASIINFEFTTNGALSSRPPIYPEKKAGAAVTSPVATEPFDIIGVYTPQNGTRYLVITTNTKTWVYNVITQIFTQIATFKAADCTQYDDKVVLCRTDGSGGYWSVGYTFTSTPTMPPLGGIEVFQNRFFGYGVSGTTTASTLYWSDITTFGPAGELTSIWDWQDDTGNYFYVEIGIGDGQWITAIDQGYNDIVIFRNRSTYRFSYGDDPALGNMAVMQQDIGADSKRSVQKFENAHFVLCNGILYRYQNWIFYPLNAKKVRFNPSTVDLRRFEHAVSLVGRRIIVWNGGGIYVHSLDTDTWSEWETMYDAAYFVTVPKQDESGLEELYYGVTGNTSAVGTSITDFTLFRIEDYPTSVVGSEEMQCRLRTKIYDFDTPSEWKRLFFWTVDLQSAYPVKATAYPVALGETAPVITWDELSKDFPTEVGYKTWDELSKDGPTDVTYGTWDNLGLPSGGIATTVGTVAYGFPTRLEAKLNQSLRFRRIYFELYLTCDGTALTSPAQIFSITPLISAKARVANGAN